MKKVLVTGGTGFVGRQLLDTLNRKKSYIRLLSRVKQKKYDTVICDLLNDKIPAEALQGCDTVFHLAGFSHDTRNANKIESLYRTVNVDATIQLAELAAASGVKKFIYVSSVKAGGSALPGKCMAELDQGEPEGVYGKTKREAELGVLAIGKQSGMHVSILRPALVYGAGVKGNLHKMLSAIKKGRFPPLPETRNSRSMVHVDDLVVALVLVAECDNANGEIFIITDGYKYSSNKLYEAICLAFGVKIPRWRIPVYCFRVLARFGDVITKLIPFPFDSARFQKLLGDECYTSNKIRKLLGFKSKLTFFDALPDMVEGVQKINNR